MIYKRKLLKKIIKQSSCKGYELFMCSSGAEANENALQIASFHNNKITNYCI